MNMTSKKINAILLAMVVACAPAYGAETQSIEQQDTTQTSVVWYKKRSTHLIAATAATAIGLYALAVRKNKIAGPVALFTALFCTNKKAQEVNQSNDTKDADKEQSQDNNSDLVTSKDQKTVAKEIPSVDQDQQKMEIGQSPTAGDNLPIISAPLHMQAKEYATHALARVKDWIAAGLTAENSLQN